MSFRDGWVVASFSTEKGFGTIANPQAGAEVAFNIESWSPCDPGTALILAESERRRHWLMPQLGEGVDVSWKDATRSGAPVKVTRRAPLTNILPPMEFSAWVWRMGRHVEQLARWTDEEWALLYKDADEGIEEAIRSPELITPELHFALLEVLRDHGPRSVAHRFTWIENAPKPGLTAVESFNETGTAFVSLAPAVIDRLVEERLILRG